MKKTAFILLLFFSVTVSAQKEASNWYFGAFAGIHFFDDGSVAPLDDSAMNTAEGCSSISDSNGNLLFYTDGRNVWDRNHVVMPNGNYDMGTGLLGDPSSTQSGIIVPNKNNPDIYYIFTVDEPHHTNAEVYPDQYTGEYAEANGTTSTIPLADDGFNNGLNYSIVNLSVTGTNGSIGDITTRNVHLLTYDPDNDDEAKYKCSEKITAVKNGDGTGFWVITHFIDKFYAFSVTGSGVVQTPVVTQLNPIVPISGYRRNAIGCIKASPNGKRIAIAHVQRGTVTGGSDNNGAAYVYDFDDSTGILSNPVAVNGNAAAYGVEFSPKSEKLYVSYGNEASGFGGVHQYDLTSSDVEASDVFIGSSTQSATLQLGPNGKIYRAVVQSGTLDVINFPDESGTACGFQPNGVNLGSGISIFGLPPFITSFLLANITITHNCFGEATQFELAVTDTFDSVSWDFGDGSPATAEESPGHIYAATGTYNVVASITRQGETTQVHANVTIHAIPVAETPPDLTACDPQNDGTAQFDLSQNDAAVLGLQNAAAYNVRYFAAMADAINNLQPVDALSYTNTSDPQTVYVRIENKINPNCYDITMFHISTLPSPEIPATDEAQVCRNTGDPVTLKAIEGSTEGFTFSWSTGAVTPTIQVTQPGIYNVTVYNSLGCGNTKAITVLQSDVAVIDEVIVDDLRENNTVTVMASVPANAQASYLYSLDLPNGPYKASNVFEEVAPGIHTVYVYSECGVVSKDIAVLSIPKFFTPNGDGVNDTWNIVGMNHLFYKNSRIYIFDRYGKLLADVNPVSPGWDGIYKGYKLPADDYWYVVSLDNGRTVKGHFSMLR
jgi:gliding motility-associated-like protein